MPKILADGVLALREQAVLAQLVNRDLQAIAQRKGNVINVPIPSTIAARSVTPGTAFATNVDSAPTVALVTLDQWYEAPLNLSDSDQASADPMFITMQASEAVRSLANNVDQYIISKHVVFSCYAGVQGTTPFNGSLNVAAQASKVLNVQLAPPSNRRAVIDPSAELNLKLNTQILQFDQRGSTEGLIEGTIGRKRGFDWYMDQNITTFTPGTAWVTGWVFATAGATVGQVTIPIINSTASGTILVGDIFSYGAGNYVITAAATATATTVVNVQIKPALATAAVSWAAITAISTAYTVNLAFHRDAWAFA